MHMPQKLEGSLPALCASLVLLISACATGTATRPLRGMYSYMADAGSFIDCASGARLLVAQEGENAALEEAYTQARLTPGGELLAEVEGRIESRKALDGAGPKQTLVVEKFLSAGPGNCGTTASEVALENTYWRLVSLGDQPVAVADREREPHLILQPAQKRVAGHAGCNRFGGSYTLEGERLKFGELAGTMMACADGMEREGAFHAALERVVQWRVTGEQLELLDASGEPVARFEARYMR